MTNLAYCTYAKSTVDPSDLLNVVPNQFKLDCFINTKKDILKIIKNQNISVLNHKL